MIPDPPEIAILAIICAAITGLLKLDTLGEWVWRIRCWISPSLEYSPESTSKTADTRSDDDSHRDEVQP